jgi:hypothetical protein
MMFTFIHRACYVNIIIDLKFMVCKDFARLVARIFNRIAKLIGGYIKDSKYFTIFNLKTLANFN